MAEIYITKEAARKFILYKQGLLGDYRFEGKSGILDFILQAGCIQFDPIEKLLLNCLINIGNFGKFAIAADDTVVCSIGVFRCDNIHSRTAEMGYYIGEPYWGKGLATSAVKQTT